MSSYKRLLKISGIEDEYADDYKDKVGRVTPYHILFKNFGDEIASLEGVAALDFIKEKILDFNEQYKEDENYYLVDESEIQRFELEFEREEVDSGMDALFLVKDFLLETEGLDKVSKIKSRLVKKSKK